MSNSNPGQSHSHLPHQAQHHQGHQVAGGKQPVDQQHSGTSQHHEAEGQERHYNPAKKGAIDFATWSGEQKTQHKQDQRNTMKNLLKAPGRRARRILGFGGSSKSKQPADAQSYVTLSEPDSHYNFWPGGNIVKKGPEWQADHNPEFCSRRRAN